MSDCSRDTRLAVALPRPYISISGRTEMLAEHVVALLDGPIVSLQLQKRIEPLRAMPRCWSHTV